MQVSTTEKTKGRGIGLHFKCYDKQDLLSATRLRRFETKLGERIQVVADKNNIEESLGRSTARFVVFGIPEDIGVRANYGVGGADSAWATFLPAFLNVQSNDFLSGDELLLLGHFDFSDVKRLIEQNAHSNEERIDAYRHAVYTIDDEVEGLTKLITEHGKVPIAIGGGHNNAYPLLKGAAKGLYKAGLIPLAQINCVNLDAHTDFRPSEGRHSGNGFRYAKIDGFLDRYAMVGLHENYNSMAVMADVVAAPDLQYASYEDIFLKRRLSFEDAVLRALNFISKKPAGIELDVDCIERTLSSAATPCGITALQARQYIHWCAQEARVAYLHLTEGAVQLRDGRTDTATAKLIAYLVTDFIKALGMD